MDSSWVDLKEYINNYKFKAISEDPSISAEKPITLLLGSGIHNLIEPQNSSHFESLKRLSSWDSLLDSIAVKNNLYKDIPPTLRWELLALNYVDQSILVEDLKASVREKKLKKKLQEQITHDENCLIELARDAFNPLQTMIKNHIVSDIITLNVDLLLENVLRKNQSAACSFPSNINTKSTLSRHRIIEDKSNTFCVRVWHPHGDRKNLDSLTFGLWQYEKSTKSLKEVFSHIKREEREKGYVLLSDRINKDPKNWVEIMITRPIIVIGTSLNQNEWDVWLTLITRWRNYAKQINKKYNTPIWYLCTYKQVRNGDLAHIPNGYIQRLVAPDWQTGWKWLEDVFK